MKVLPRRDEGPGLPAGIADRLVRENLINAECSHDDAHRPGRSRADAERGSIDVMGAGDNWRPGSKTGPVGGYVTDRPRHGRTGDDWRQEVFEISSPYSARTSSDQVWVAASVKEWLASVGSVAISLVRRNLNQSLQ